MRILHIIARFNVGGTATWISNLSQSLNHAGHESFVLSGRVQKGEVEDSRFKSIGGMHVTNLGRKIALAGDIKALFAIRSQIKQINPDVINTHTAKAGVLGRLAALSLGAKRPALVHTIHGHLFRGYFNKLTVTLISRIESLLSRYTEVMLFAGEKVKTDCMDQGIKHQLESRIVMPGLSSLAPKSRTRTKITVGWLARFAKVKQPKLVLELATIFPEVNFLLGGDGPLRTETVKMAPSNCTFFGWVESPEEFWAQCDIALLTSDNEALPISLIEAQMCSLPCVTTPAGSASEVVIDGINGFVSREFSSESLGEPLLKLINDSSLRRRLGNQGRIRANEIFSLERQLSDHIEAYQLAINLRIGG
jgi:glycosyltransferase involved in cell wall biosynthesis